MRDFIKFADSISIENAWPFYLLLYAAGLIVTIVAIRKNKKKKQEKLNAEEKDLDDLLK